jgi:hypothetical protein
LGAAAWAAGQAWIGAALWTGFCVLILVRGKRLGAWRYWNFSRPIQAALVIGWGCLPFTFLFESSGYVGGGLFVLLCLGQGALDRKAQQV